MLKKLNIKNLAIIKELQLDFRCGLSVLTGETGAGKSILLDALSMALGMRADSGLVKYGTRKSVVNAEFNIQGIELAKEWLEDKDLDNADNINICFVRRTLNAEGGSNAYINGSQVTIGMLKDLGDLLIDIHGQHEHQSLLESIKQLDLLDAYANLLSERKRMRYLFKEINELKQTIKNMHTNREKIIARRDLLSFKLDEILTIDPKPNEYFQLVKEHKLLANVSNIKNSCVNVYEVLENSEISALSNIIKANRELELIADTNEEIENISSQLNSIEIDLQDVTSQIVHFMDSFDLDPNRFTELDERLSTWLGLAKKYNISPENLVAEKNKIEDELKLIDAPDLDLEQLEQKLNNTEQEFGNLTNYVSSIRHKNIEILEQEVITTISELGMQGGEFRINLEPITAPASYGKERIEFLVSANKGQPLKPLKKIASGGELSRISLAIQVATAKVVTVPTLIFDEVDVGIGGAIAEVVGHKMAKLAKSRQIISITHQPQVAAFCDVHYKVSKHTSDITSSEVVILNNEEQVLELARMLGGINITETTLNHAREMKNNSKVGG